MCCCRPELTHNEEEKFILLGNKDKKVFDMIDCEDKKFHQPQKGKMNQNKIRLTTSSKDCNLRNKE
jgi:hypothetical protein